MCLNLRSLFLVDGSSMTHCRFPQLLSFSSNQFQVLSLFVCGGEPDAKYIIYIAFIV